MHPSVATELGILSALRTGDPVRDLALCAAVPLTLDRLRESPQTIASLVESAKQRVGDVLAGGRRYTTHVVELQQFGHDSATHIKSIDDHDHRELLFKAVGLYVADHVSLAGHSGRYALFLKAETDALEAALLDDPRLVQRQRSQIKHILETNRDIAQLDVLPLPPIGQWIPLTDDGLQLQYVELEAAVVSKRSRVRSVRKQFIFRSRAADAPQQIRAFVERAFAYFTDVEQRKVLDDTKRYLYVRDTASASLTGKDDETHDDDDTSSATKAAPRYKRYALGEEKTFATVFFDEKPSVLKLLDDFTQRKGKFAIDGFPNKLGLLLHGPPGTGKTSLIKAIAQHTKRHIVSISLAQIQTNQELLDAMTELRFGVRGVTLPVKLTVEDVVFVMEDVDCAASVVQRRNEEGTEKREAERNLEDEEHPLALLADLFGPDERLRARGLVDSSNRNDRLNLAGLLNVLDGVIDCPGRIVIMTTNHPEKLDPALVRPGRVNKKLHLGYMPSRQIQKMLAYYFDTTLATVQEERVLSLPQGITPAQVEEICAEHDDVESAVCALERRVKRASTV